MAKYKAYPEYKTTGLGWLTEIPDHWEVKKLKYLGQAIIGLTYSPDDVVDEGEGTLVLRSSNVQNGKLEFLDNVYVRKLIPLHLKVKEGDILICARNGSRALIGKNAKITKDAEGMTFGAFMSIFRSKYNNYLSHVFASALFEYQSSSFLTATINQLTTSNLNSFEIPLPPQTEQDRIVNFLDHETTKIDNLIEKQQQLIDLLKEKRQAVISHAVTKGLNPDVPMKDSGVEWLGDIPSHWLCTKIKHIALLTPKKSSVNFKNNDECTFIPMEKLKRNSLVTDESKLIRDVISGYTYFEDDDLLLAKVTPCFENKNIAVARGLVNSIGFGSTEIYVLRPTEKIRVNYLLYRLQEDNFIRAATAAMIGAGGLKRVPSDFLLNYPIAIPPKPEMDAIVAYLNAQEVHYDLMEKNATQAVQLLQERRTALISAAVTGKIDVRDWVAPDKQDVEEPQEATA